ncbi:DUF2281 domain-containing protein [Pyrococcus kukulkanii]
MPDDLKREVIDYIEFLTRKESEEKTRATKAYMEGRFERV